jgi:RHS repeat-associated protein
VAFGSRSVMNETRGGLEVPVQHEGIEVGSVGPYDSAQLVIYLHLSEVARIGQRLEHRTVQLPGEIDVACAAIAEATQFISGETGTTEAAYSYTPYGAIEEHTGTATTPFSYDGQYTNTDTGLIYLRARNYDPATGEFLSVDPLEAISGEPYSYAGDSPTTYGDSSGLLWTPLAGGADAACGATFEIPGVDIGTCGAAGIASGAAAIGAAVGVVTAVAGEEGGDEGEAELKEKEAERENCGNPATSPGSKFEWRGKGEVGSKEGSWFDPENDESLHPDLKNEDHGPHYDYKAPDESKYRIYPDGRIEPK